jgi:ABC-2 type transport system ATP-binding protein
MIEVKNLTKSYSDKDALKDISFIIKPGQIVGLLGLNGAGKSTIMNIMTGYISATSGTVSIGGFDILNDGKKAKKLIGYLPEQPAFYPEMKVNEHLDFICDLKMVSKDKIKRREYLDDICRRTGIIDVQKRMVRNLSKGYRQRVGFASALIGKPKVLILDEPTAGLDPSQIKEMRNLIMECGRDSTVIISSHILFEIGAVCDRVLIINEGVLIADDTPDNLLSKFSSSSLEDVFLKLTVGAN